MTEGIRPTIIVLAAIATIFRALVATAESIWRFVHRDGHNEPDHGSKPPTGPESDPSVEGLTLLQNSRYLSKHVTIHGYYQGTPVLTSLGRLKVDRATGDRAKKLKSKITIDMSSRYAVLKSDDCLRRSSKGWEYYYTDFATILARRKMAVEAGRGPRMQPLLQVSSCAVVLCEESRKLLLHQRSASSHSYPGRYHTFGGGYIVPECQWRTGAKIKPTPTRQDRSGVLETISRELCEETGIAVSVPDIDPVKKAVVTELDTGYVQFVALGVNIPQMKIDSESRNEEKEGYVKRFSFDELPEILSDPSLWVPTGLAHVLLWLCSATQSDGTKFTFGTETGEQLVMRAIRELDKRDYNDTSVLTY